MNQPNSSGETLAQAAALEKLAKEIASSLWADVDWLEEEERKCQMGIPASLIGEATDRMSAKILAALQQAQAPALDRAQLLSWAAQLVRAVCAPCPDDIGEPVRIVALEMRDAAYQLPRAQAPSPAWQPMETAPRGAKAWYWIVPKSEDETYTDTSGRPILGGAEPHAQVCAYGGWGALYKATHWQPYVIPAAPGVAAAPTKE